MNKKIIIIVAFIIFLTSTTASYASWNIFKNVRICIGGCKLNPEQEEIRKAFDALVSDYTSKNITGFMNGVSEKYTHYKDILERNIRDDFFNYSYIDITYVINNIIPDSKNKYAVSINYNRKLEDRRTGKVKPSRGTFNFIMIKEEGAYKLYSMKRPYLFGISNN